MTSPVVLITGCSSGIGRSLCWEFHRRGFQVIATARQPAAIADLEAAGMLTLALDVTHTDTVQQVVKAAHEHTGRLDILINNAGYGLFGPLMDVSQEAIMQQFATNVFAPLQLIQTVAPIMKAQGSGLILNIGSISGILTTPFAGAYGAAKAALHHLSDALRVELAPFGIRVVTVYPGAIASQFGSNAQTTPLADPNSDSWYRAIADQVQSRATLSQQNATPAEVFAQQLVDQILVSSPPAEIRLGKKSFQLPFLKRWLPTKWLDRLLAKRFGLTQQNLS
jgi:NAD(P)-dependent dehydrogenase (short-subunit alcohol dehydrogenase family)